MHCTVVMNLITTQSERWEIANGACSQRQTLFNEVWPSSFHQINSFNYLWVSKNAWYLIVVDAILLLCSSCEMFRAPLSPSSFPPRPSHWRAVLFCRAEARAHAPSDPTSFCPSPNHSKELLCCSPSAKNWAPCEQIGQPSLPPLPPSACSLTSPVIAFCQRDRPSIFLLSLRTWLK